MDKKILKPRIRFKGFTDDWEQCELGKEGKTFSGLIGKSKRDFGHGKGYFIPYMNIFKNFICDTKMLEPIEIDDTQTTVKYGDVFFTTSSETPEEVGMSSIWTKNADNTYLNSFCFGYRLNNFDKYDLKFLAYNFRSDCFRKKIIFLAQGISRFNISKNKVMEIKTLLPLNKSEQKEIGDFLYSIDNLITLHQRKYEKLKQIKKSLLEKMFPTEGASVPKIRFKGFTDDWEQRKLNELCSYESSNLTVKDALADGDYDLYDANTLVGRTNKNVISKEYISIIKDGAGVGRIRKLPKNTAILGTMGALKPEKCDYLFLFSLLEKADLSSLFSGSTIPHIYFKDYGNNNYLIPFVNEQEKIGQFFYRLDSLITLHQRKYEKLKNIKKSLLDKMFV